jgi:hypothetical protein
MSCYSYSPNLRLWILWAGRNFRLSENGYSPSVNIGIVVETGNRLCRNLTFMWPCIMINFLIIKPTRHINFSNLFLEWNYTCLGQFLCPSSGVFHCTGNNGICHIGLLTACEQDQNVPSWSCSQAVWHTIIQCITPDDEQRNCPKTCRVSFQEYIWEISVVWLVLL